MSSIIRKATTQDIDAVAAIEAICFPPAEAAGREAIAQRIAAFTNTFLVAERDGAVVGFINGCVTNQDTLTDDLYESTRLHDDRAANVMVFGLDVIPSQQHQGIAKALMNEYIAAARRNDKKKIILTCKDHLVSFYEGFGYVCRGKSASTHGGAVWYDMVLVL